MNETSENIRELTRALSLEVKTTEELNEITARYPYFGFSQFLLARKAKQEHDTNAVFQLQRCALYFSNPFWLHFLLSEEDLPDLETETFLPTFTEEKRDTDPSEPDTASVTDTQNAISQAGLDEHTDPVLPDSGAEPETLKGISQEEDTNEVTDMPKPDNNPSAEASNDIAQEMDSYDQVPSSPLFTSPDAEISNAFAENNPDEQTVLSTPDTRPATDISIETDQNEGLDKETDGSQPENNPADETRKEDAEKGDLHDRSGKRNDIATEEPVIEFPGHQLILAEDHPTVTANKDEVKVAEEREHKEEDIGHVEGSSDDAELGKLSKLIEQHLSEYKKPVNGDEEIPVTAKVLHAIDYFASQGIKLDPRLLTEDMLGNKVKKFTDWLKQMKRFNDNPTDLGTDLETEHLIEKIAQTSNETKDVVTETMAQVLAKQGKTEKAVQLYQKLSFLNPSKSAYFAAKINDLKGSK